MPLCLEYQVRTWETTNRYAQLAAKNIHWLCHVRVRWRCGSCGSLPHIVIVTTELIQD